MLVVKNPVAEMDEDDDLDGIDGLHCRHCISLC